MEMSIVDELKIAYVDSKIAHKVLHEIDAKDGKIAKMTITWGKVHKYLKMTINYSLPGKLLFSIVDYIGKMFNDIPEDMRGGSSTTAAHHFFGIVEEGTKLSQTNIDLFHNFVAQLLYQSK